MDTATTKGTRPEPGLDGAAEPTPKGPTNPEGLFPARGSSPGSSASSASSASAASHTEDRS